MVQYPTTRACEFVANTQTGQCTSLCCTSQCISLRITSRSCLVARSALRFCSLTLPSHRSLLAQKSTDCMRLLMGPLFLSKSITGGTLMLAGASILDICQRQHLAAPDSHSNEIVAATTVLHAVVPVRGLLQECSVHQAEPTPFYVDSGSTVSIAGNRSAPKRSVWLQRRTLVLHEGEEQREVKTIHISERDNIADPNTKYLTYKVMRRHRHYKCNVDGDPPACRY